MIEKVLDRKWSDCHGGKTARDVWLIMNKLPPPSAALKYRAALGSGLSQSLAGGI